MLNGLPECHQGRKVHGAIGVLWKSCTSCSSAEMDLCATISCQLVQQSGTSFTVRLALHCKQPEVLEHGAILLHDSATPHHHCDVENLAQCWGWAVVA